MYINYGKILTHFVKDINFCHKILSLNFKIMKKALKEICIWIAINPREIIIYLKTL